MSSHPYCPSVGPVLLTVRVTNIHAAWLDHTISQEQGTTLKKPKLVSEFPPNPLVLYQCCKTYAPLKVNRNCDFQEFPELCPTSQCN